MTESGAARPVTLPVMPAVGAVCPYLLAADRAWRASTATREHRCTAVAPAAILAPDKQRRLCLVAEHGSCSTYLAATSADRGAAVAAGLPSRATSRAIVRTTPLLLDHGRVSVTMPSLLPERRLGQTGLVALMAIAFMVIVVTRLSSGGPDLAPGQVVVIGSPSPSADATSQPTRTPAVATPVPTPAATPLRTLVPTEVEPTPPPATAAPTPTPSASTASRTYTVQRGDTLSGIAGQFGTSWKVLASLNGIDDPRSLRVGQVLQLP